MFGAMFPGPLIRGRQHGVSMRLIEPGKPNQNACIESFNERLRDECLNEYWLLNLDYAQAVIEGMGGGRTARWSTRICVLVARGAEFLLKHLINLGDSAGFPGLRVEDSLIGPRRYREHLIRNSVGMLVEGFQE